MKGDRQRGDTREREVASVSAGLKDLAKRLSVPVLALSQLNRSLEQRGQKDKRPKLSDLRESGSIENDADCVWLLYRESYYDRQAGNAVEIDVAKQRNGPTDIVHLAFDRTSMRYYDAETRDGYDDLFNQPDKYVEGEDDNLKNV
jgi:replicative DNA helicase